METSSVGEDIIAEYLEEKSIKYKKQYIKYSIRMLGYNSPELNDKDKGGLQHRDELHKLIFGKIVWLECDHFCKYGRILGTIYYKGKNINEHMKNYAI